MILTYSSYFKSDFITSYKEFISSLQLHVIRCPECNHYALIRHGFYNRHILTDEEDIVLRVVRVKCKHCGKTHAILPSTLVPYQQVPVDTQYDIITDYFNNKSIYSSLERHPFIDESLARAILKRFASFWKERLIAASIKMDSIKDLVFKCISNYKLQFMQIRYTPISIFSPPT